MAVVADTLVSLMSFIFGTVNDTASALTKLAIFTLLLLVFLKGATRAFPDDPRIAKVVSVIVALLAVRLMPPLWLPAIGSFIWVMLAILLPYLVVDKMIKKWSIVKGVFLAAIYLGVYLLVSGNAEWGFGVFGSFARNFRDYWYYYNWQILFALAGLVVFIIFRHAKKEKS